MKRVEIYRLWIEGEEGKGRRAMMEAGKNLRARLSKRAEYSTQHLKPRKTPSTASFILSIDQLFQGCFCVCCWRQPSISKASILTAEEETLTDARSYTHVHARCTHTHSRTRTHTHRYLHT